LKHLAAPQKTGVAQNLSIDPATRRNLELTRTLAGEKQGSLLAAIDRTLTGAGARMLASRLVAPLTDVATINQRLDAVALMKKADELRGKLREALRQTPDLERALARLALGRGGPRDLASVRDALRSTEQIRSALLPAAGKSAEIAEQTEALGEHNTLADKLAAALAPELPLLARDGNFIARGFSAQLDELVTLRDDSRRVIAQLQQKYSQRSNVPALKIRHNNVIGYYIEVTVELGELERKIN
jgi:DNA mismatch repair protein MutS